MIRVTVLVSARTNPAKAGLHLGDTVWKLYLEGRGTLDEALIALLKAKPAG